MFIHSFLDDNGRIHRFLMHDMLTRDGLPERGLIIPVSALMLNHMAGYDALLEAFSKRLMQRILFNRGAKGELMVTIPHEVAAYSRYPDLAVQSTYLAHTIQSTIQHDLSDELYFLQRYDELKAGLQNLIHMPERKLNALIIFIHQNKGIFPSRREKHFSEITAGEFEAIHTIYTEYSLKINAIKNTQLVTVFFKSNHLHPRYAYI